MKWCEDEPLYVSFPSLYALVVQKGACMADLWDQSSEEGYLNPCLGI